MKQLKQIFILSISMLIVGCGFHLRGNQDFSVVLPELQIQGISKNSDLGRELIRALVTAKVNVFDESNVILRLTQSEVSKRVISVDRAGRANQYELRYQLGFSLVKKKLIEENVKGDKKPQHVVLIAKQNIIEKREYVFDANFILAKANEESRLKNDMQQAAIQQLLRRLWYLLRASTQFNKTVK